jgi:hypothetical protein
VSGPPPDGPLLYSGARLQLVRPVVFGVRSDELPDDVDVTWPDLPSDPEHGSIPVSEAQRPAIGALEPVNAQPGRERRVKAVLHQMREEVRAGTPVCQALGAAEYSAFRPAREAPSISPTSS